MRKTPLRSEFSFWSGDENFVSETKSEFNIFRELELLAFEAAEDVKQRWSLFTYRLRLASRLCPIIINVKHDKWTIIIASCRRPSLQFMNYTVVTTIAIM